MIKKSIITGLGILILLMLAGTVSATPAVTDVGQCAGCHGFDGTYFNNTHKFDGISRPFTSTSCGECHAQLPTPNNWANWKQNMSNLTANGSFYNTTHRINSSTLASQLFPSQTLPAGGCNNCHVDVVNENFSLITGGTQTFLTSTVCEDCHKAKYDNWTNTLHAVMLTNASKAQAMGLPTPPVGWANISYVVITKFQFSYINLTGNFLAQNDTYNTETQQFQNSENGTNYSKCISCHVTGYNNSSSTLPGINATFSEPGIACERCHGPGGNGHQVTVNYSGTLCTVCHSGSHHGTGWENSEHYPPAAENGSSCLKCHSPFDLYSNPNVTLANTTAQSCGVCHNIHDMTDSKYAATFSNDIFNPTTWSVVADAKLSFFNATASVAAGTDIFDNLSNAVIYPSTSAGIGNASLNLTGKPVSEALCSECHYNHGLAHTNGVNLTHGTHYHGQSNAATCTDCHMAGANATIGHDMMFNHSNDIFIFNNKPDSASANPANTCGGTNKACHESSSQNQSASSHSMVPIFNGWNASAHNDKVVSFGGAIGNHFYGTFNASNNSANNQRPNTCLQCKSPINWNPANTDNVTNINLTDFHGISCMVCHDIHDMGAWINKTGKVYAWYNKTAIKSGTRYTAAYQVMDNTTQLCGNCHDNIRAGSKGPGWSNSSNGTSTTTPTSAHGIPAAAVFVGSWKQTGLLKFECIDCHFSTNMSVNLTDSQKVGGHSFKVNVTLLQNDQGNQKCSTCHVTGSALGNLSTTIANVTADTKKHWNDTNAIVMGALANYTAWNVTTNGPKNLSATYIAQAYWNLKLVSSNNGSSGVTSGEGSWGVHNPTMDSQLLDQAQSLANLSNLSLGQGAYVSNVTLKSGLNLVSLQGTPAVTQAASVMYSVQSNISAVWGYNASATPSWQVYSPNAVNPNDNTLATILPPPAAYFIYANANVQWTV